MVSHKEGDFVRVPAWTIDKEGSPTVVEMSGTVRKVIETYDGVEHHEPLYVVELEDGTVDSFTGGEFLEEGELF